MNSNKGACLRRAHSTSTAECTKMLDRTGNLNLQHVPELVKWTSCCRSAMHQHQACFARRNSWTVFINDDGCVKQQLENDSVRFEPNSDLFAKRRGSSPQVYSDRHLSNQFLANGVTQKLLLQQPPPPPNHSQQRKKLPQAQLQQHQLHRRSCSLYHRPSRCLAATHRMSSYSNDGMNQANCTTSRCSRVVHIEGCKTPCRDSAYSSDGEVELTIFSSTTPQSNMPLLSTEPRSCMLRRGSSLVDRKYMPSDQLLPYLGDQNKALSTPMIIKEKVRSLKEKIRKHAVQSSANGDDWPPPRAIFGERYTNISLPASAASELLHVKGSIVNPVQQPKGNSHRVVKNQNGARLRRRSQSMNCKRTASTKGSGLGDIVVSDSDLRAIIKSVQAHSSNMNELTKEHPKLPSSQSSKMRFIRKQVSFDDKECIIRSDARKVSIIQEEIDHSTLNSLTKAEFVPVTEHQHQVKETVLIHVPNPQETVDNALKIEAELQVDKVNIKSDVSNRETTPREIEFDENGQTWDIYGAEFDHMLLGDAIERHLATTFKRRSLQLEIQPTKLNSVVFDTDVQTDCFISNTRCSQFLRYLLCLKKSHKVGFEPIHKVCDEETAL